MAGPVRCVASRWSDEFGEERFFEFDWGDESVLDRRVRSRPDESVLVGRKLFSTDENTTDCGMVQPLPTRAVSSHRHRRLLSTISSLRRPPTATTASAIIAASRRHPLLP